MLQSMSVEELLKLTALTPFNASAIDETIDDGKSGGILGDDD